MTGGPTTPIGGGADDELVRATADEDLGRLPLASQDDPKTFADAVLRYCQKWIKRAGTQKECVAAFVNEPRTAIDGEERVIDFCWSYGEPLAGYLHRSGPGLNNVWRTSGAGTTIAELARVIHHYGLSNAPAVLVDFESGEAVFQPNGVVDETTAYQYYLAGPEATVTGVTLRSFLDSFHEACIQTPTRGVPLWTNAGRGIPARSVEGVIQDYLIVSARVFFKDVILQWEVSTAEGRTDVYIAPGKKETAGEPCVLELKVLRSRAPTRKESGNPKAWSLRKNQEWVAKGIDQAHTYRSQMAAELAYVCCYDMRDTDDGDAIVSVVQSVADAVDVKVLRYFVYRSVEDLRTARPGSAMAELLRSRGN